MLGGTHCPINARIELEDKVGSDLTGFSTVMQMRWELSMLMDVLSRSRTTNWPRLLAQCK